MTSRTYVRYAFRVTGLLVALLMLSLAGCAGFGGVSEEMAMSADRYEPSYEAQGTSGAAMPLAESDLAPAPASRSALSSVPGGGLADQITPPEGEPAGDQGSDAQATEAATRRLRVYTADLELSVVSIQETRERIISYVDDAGGYIESSGDDFLVARVPAAGFQESLAEVLSYGDVLARSVQTADVTDQYFDLERRLEIATASRDRLYELLERAEDADERVEILRDIRRLTEEIEQLRSSLDSLSRLISYSRITVRLRARIQTSANIRDRIPFRWIAALDPLSVTVGEASAPIGIQLPSEFAVFRADTLVRAESADGVRLKAGARRNDPSGDAAFWQEALAYHLGPLFRTVTKVEVGPFRGVVLESKDASPFSYMVVVATRRDELVVVEAFFPDSESREATEPAVMASLREVEL